MPLPIHSNMGRRPFLAGSAALIGSWAVPLSFSSFLYAQGPRGRTQLSAVRDESTGLPLILLPEGFRYRSFGWTGDPLEGGAPTPAAHDGMAVIGERDGVLMLCRNHELSSFGKSFGPPELAYDGLAAGGCTNLLFDATSGQWIKAWCSLAGTIKNCAGGPTPWGAWLSCEESLVQAGDLEQGKKVELEQAHGYIFEVP